MKPNLPLDARYLKILNSAVPYILSYPGNLKSYNLKPFGIPIPKDYTLGAMDMKNAPFFDLLQRLDQISFGPVGMPMEKWVFYDCGEMPGGIFGFGILADQLTPDGRAAFELDTRFDGYRGLVPISMYIAIPFPQKGRWFGHNLSSSAKHLGSLQLPGLGILTKAMAVDVFRIREMIGATQWNSPSLNIHLQLSDMEVLSAYTPAHTFPHTMTYRSVYNRTTQIRALRGTPREAAHYHILLDVEDEEHMKEVQQQIEFEGKRFIIQGRPISKENKIFIPLSELTRGKSKSKKKK